MLFGPDLVGRNQGLHVFDVLMLNMYAGVLTTLERIHTVWIHVLKWGSGSAN